MFIGYLLHLHTGMEGFGPQFTLVGVYSDSSMAIKAVEESKRDHLLDDLPVGSIVMGAVEQIPIDTTLNKELFTLNS